MSLGDLVINPYTQLAGIAFGVLGGAAALVRPTKDFVQYLYRVFSRGLRKANRLSAADIARRARLCLYDPNYTIFLYSQLLTSVIIKLFVSGFYFLSLVAIAIFRAFDKIHPRPDISDQFRLADYHSFVLVTFALIMLLTMSSLYDAYRMRLVRNRYYKIRYRSSLRIIDTTSYA